MPSSKPPKLKPLRISAPARRDLESIGEYTRRQWGAAQKRKYLRHLQDKLIALQASPAIGAPRDDVSPGLRGLAALEHIIFYRESETALLIVRILHTSQDVTAHIRG